MGRISKRVDQMLSGTSTRSAPWHVIPADHKWFARLATAAVLVQTLVDTDPKYPRVDPGVRKLMEEARAKLLAELDDTKSVAKTNPEVAQPG